ncbi:MAG TPA: TaqI-like C-terminal specificity domain-containing protein, partial [Tepidisphaeraceae bacterium]
SPYEFTMVSADILGSVYERFLGKVITRTAGHNARIEEKPEVRKAGGVYYTPTYIVDYIVKNTIGKLLENKTPKDAAKIKVLDPACGSGSFLIGAYQFLLDWYHTQYTTPPADPAALATGKNPVLRPGLRGGWSLTIAQRKRILLDHIHGVDLDDQAVEVTKLNLLLKCLEGETSQTLGFEQRLFRERALPDLGKNILCGNSLIGTDIIGTDAWNAMSEEEQGKINPFDYERAFPAVFKQSGFDAVIGNPPYIRMEAFKPVKTYLANAYQCHDERSDLYAYVMERSHRLLRSAALFGMIVSNKFVRANYGKPLRGSLTKLALPIDIVDFAGLPVFEGATVRTLIYIAKKTAEVEGTRYTPPAERDRFAAIASKLVTVEADVQARSYELGRGWFERVDWSFSRPEVTALMNRLRLHPRLVQTVDGQICMGVKSGLGEAFVISTDIRDALIRANPEAAEIIKPLLNGRDIRRYRAEPQGQFLLYLTHGINIGRYPAVEKHLRPYKTALERRATRQNWYELQQPQERYSAWMSGPKIVFPDIATHPRFALDEDGYFGTNTVYFIPRTDRVLLGLLNSRLGFLYFQQVCAGLEGGDEIYLRFFGQYLEGFPVAAATPNQSLRLTTLVDSMLSLHKRLATEQLPQRREQVQREIDATDRQIDQLVYQLYGLTDAEIQIVEEATV